MLEERQLIFSENSIRIYLKRTNSQYCLEKVTTNKILKGILNWYYCQVKNHGSKYHKVKTLAEGVSYSVLTARVGSFLPPTNFFGKLMKI